MAASTKAARLKPLLEIERRLLPETLVEGPARFGTLPEYYAAENEMLMKRFDDAKQQFQRVPVPAKQALTLVAGAAGVGKTFIKGQVFEQGIAEEAVHKFDIRELLESWEATGIATEKADLCFQQIELSRLVCVRDRDQLTLREYLRSHAANFIVVDSLDEIHPEDYVWALQQIKDFVFKDSRQFVHVVVFGRGLAFHDFWQLCQDQDDGTDVELFLLNSPAFRTTGDLLVSSHNYHTWRYDLKWAPEGGQPRSMSLDEYQQWVNSGFSREGKYQSVTFKANENMRQDVHRTLVAWAKTYPVVASMLPNLAGNSIIRDIVEDHVVNGKDYNERQVMAAYLDAWMIRDTNSNHRPSSAEPTHLKLYLSLLQQVAVRYLENGNVDVDGYFPVTEGDTIAIHSGGELMEFRVKSILDRSGLTFINPRQGGSVTSYRFDPIWFHRLLAELHNENFRLAKKAESPQQL